MQAIRKAIVFASYHEAENLALLLRELAQRIDPDTAVLISDDSGPLMRDELVAGCSNAFSNSTSPLLFSFSEGKSGRGSAILRGFRELLVQYPNLETLLEADSDGSHRVDDIVKVLESQSDCDVVIGSRYLRESRISGWPIQRRVFSAVLNLAIPRLLGIKLNDLTNGLRSYSKPAVLTLLGNVPQNSGFIYLSEAAYLLHSKKFDFEEIPIHFENRILGQSSVGWREIVDSLLGLVRLVSLRLHD